MIMALVVNAIAFYVTANLVQGMRIDSLGVLVVVSVVWGVLSSILKPILILLTLPVNVLTLGLFTWVINAFMILIMSRLVDGFRVDGFGAAMVAAIVLSIVNLVLSKIK